MAATSLASQADRRGAARKWLLLRWKWTHRHWQYYLLILLPIAYVFVFCYIPMAGVMLAFKDYRIKLGIWGSPWIGFKHFTTFLSSPNFGVLIKNTLGISIYSLIAGFPAPIILALSLNEVGNARFKKLVQTITYAPNFISTVVMAGMLMQFLAPRTGFINILITYLGGESVNFLASPGMFKSIYVWSGIWQGMGYGAIIYLAALSGVDPELYDAARVDGASRVQKILNIDIPGIIPTIVVLLILSAGSIMQVGFEKILLLQNGLNASSSEVIATYVYKVGLISGEFSFSTAVGFFNSVVNLMLLVGVNAIARRVGESSLW